MRKSKEFALRSAIELCAVLGSGTDNTLADDVMRFIGEKRIMSVYPQDVYYQIKWNTGATLYAKFKDNLSAVNSTHHIKALQRKLWLYKIIVLNYKAFDFIELQKCVAKKFSEEQSIDPTLTDRDFVLFEILDKRIKDEQTVAEAGPVLEKMNDELSAAFCALSSACEILDCDYLSQLYSEEDAKKYILAKAYRNFAPQASPVEDGRSQEDIEKLRDMANSESEIAKIKEAAQKSERALKDVIGVLEKDNHNLKTALRFAEKDVIRNLLLSLTDYGYGAPLNELYLIMKDGETPNRIKGVVSNLFSALADLNIRLIKDKQVGETIVLDEENQKYYNPVKNEAVYLGDEVEVLYPGYKYESEIMVRPTVKKIIKEDN